MAILRRNPRSDSSDRSGSRCATPVARADSTSGGVTRSNDVIILEITLSSGRTVDIKKALYAEIVKRLEAAGVRPDDVVIALTEVAKENWSFGGGKATYA